MSKIWYIILGAAFFNAALVVVWASIGSYFSAATCGVFCLYFTWFCYYTRDIVRGGQDV